MRIIVRKCPFTGAIFEEKDRDLYIAHLKELRANKKANRAYARKKAKFERWLDAEKETLVSVDMIVPWIIKSQRKLMDACNNLRPFVRDKFYKSDELISLELISTKYTSTASNTHCCPKGGQTNFRWKEDLPRGYPGFVGTIKASLKRERKYNYSYPLTDLLEFIGIHTGSGGGGNEDCEYGATIFVADWPGLGQQLMYDVLKGRDKIIT